ncbi:MAG TPA: hypothetical protein VE999_13600 [Gemmataceae bacterium]|nr:hypothetical protein [Gemmataceae bacterium]
MSRSRTFSVVLCLLFAALPALAQKPDGKGALINDSRSSTNSQQYLTTEGPSQVGGKNLEDWRKDLKSGDPSVRAAALTTIPHFGPAASKVVPDILACLHDNDASPRAKAALAIRLMLPYISPADYTRVIKDLGRSIKGDPQLIIRFESARTYREFCRFCRPINHKIREEHDTLRDLVANVSLLSNSTFELRDACIEALIYAGVDPQTGPEQFVTKALISRANFQAEPTTQVRLKAIMALGAMGRPQNPTDYQQVMEVLKSRNNYKSSHPTVRIWSHVAIIALDEKADKKDLDTIAEYLKDRKAEVKYQAVTALGALEDKAQAYVPNLCDMVLKRGGEDDPQVLTAICQSLGRMNNKGDNVKKALIQMTEHDDPKYADVVMGACVSLAQLGINDGEASTAIKKALEHRSFNEFQKAALKRAIEEAGKPKKPVKTPQKPEKGVAPGNRNPQQNRR